MIWFSVLVAPAYLSAMLLTIHGIYCYGRMPDNLWPPVHKTDPRVIVLIGLIWPFTVPIILGLTALRYAKRRGCELDPVIYPILWAITGTWLRRRLPEKGVPELERGDGPYRTPADVIEVLEPDVMSSVVLDRDRERAKKIDIALCGGSTTSPRCPYHDHHGECTHPERYSRDGGNGMPDDMAPPINCPLRETPEILRVVA